MPSSASSPRPRVPPTDGAPSTRSPALRALPTEDDRAAEPDAEAFPIPPDWIVKDPEEDKRRIRAMLDQGARDIAAGRGYDLEEVLREGDELIEAAIAARRT